MKLQFARHITADLVTQQDIPKEWIPITHHCENCRTYVCIHVCGIRLTHARIVQADMFVGSDAYDLLALSG